MLSPPPSLLELVSKNLQADAQWKTWLNELYRAVEENMSKDPTLQISKGAIAGTTQVNKFGRNTAVGTTEEDIWDGGGTYTWPTSASITHLRSAVDSAATRGKTVEIQGLDTNWELTTQTATTDGTNSTTEVALTTALRRVFRMKNTSDTDFDQNVQVGPTGFATIGAQITNGFNQTLMALYTIPAGYTGYLTNVWTNMNRTGGASAALDVVLWARNEVNEWLKRQRV